MSSTTTDKSLSPDTLADMLRGTLGVLRMLKGVFPDVSDDELLLRAEAIEQSEVAQELLFQVVLLKKIKVG